MQIAGDKDRMSEGHSFSKESKGTNTFSAAAGEYMQRGTVSRFVQDPHGVRLSHFNFNRLH
jgi:hypothetical protein